MLRRLVIATRLLTRIPMPGPPCEGHELASAAALFPVVGALTAALSSWSMRLLSTPLGIDAAIVFGLAGSALLTGALHEDGLADTCDGLGGGTTRQRALEIMRDSRIGTYGAIALVLLYLSRFELLRSLELAQLTRVMPAAGALGASGTLLLMAWQPNARGDGLAHDVGRAIGPITVAAGFGATLLICIALTGIAAPAIVLTGLTVTFIAGLVFRRKLGGITGDCLGATSCVIEVATLACAATQARAGVPLGMLRWE